jgi:hypothetical protein
VPYGRLTVLLGDPDLSARKDAVVAFRRLTDDAQPALDLLLPDLDDKNAARGPLELLAELDTDAGGYADRIRGVLHSEDHPWLAPHAAYAWWRVTGDPTEAVPPLVDVIRRVTQGYPAGHAARLATSRLGEIGAPAAEAAPLLQWILNTDRRTVASGKWRSISDDDALRESATAALERMTTAQNREITKTRDIAKTRPTAVPTNTTR